MTNDAVSMTGIRARKNLDAYYYSFEPTGDADIDRILGAVASAGKEYHHTESWADDDIISPSPQDNIQNAANLAAKNRISAIAPGGAASVERDARELLAREYEKGDRAFMADRIRRGNTSPVDDRAIRAVEAALAASSMDTKKARLATLRAADEISAMLEDGDMKHRSKLIDLADTLRDAALATSSPVDAEKVREIEILRRALAWHGDPQRMATTREEWQQTIDDAIVWVKANPEPDLPSFSSHIGNGGELVAVARTPDALPTDGGDEPWEATTAGKSGVDARSQHADARQEAERECQAVWRCAIGDVTGALDVLKNHWIASKRKAEREAGAKLSAILDLVWAARGPAPSKYSEAHAAGSALAERVRSALALGAGER